jgi:hypothetical protein
VRKIVKEKERKGGEGVRREGGGGIYYVYNLAKNISLLFN